MPAELNTPWCRLRRPALADAEAIYANYASDPEVTRYVLWPTHASVTSVRDFLADAVRRNRTDAEWTWCLTLPGSDDCVGMIGINPAAHRGELGYVLDRRHWGRGIMTAAAGAVIGWCFAQAGLQRVWATCAVANQASVRVLEKLGMWQEGILRGWHVFPNLSAEAQDCYMFSRLASDS